MLRHAAIIKTLLRFLFSHGMGHKPLYYFERTGKERKGKREKVTPEFGEFMVLHIQLTMSLFC